MFEKKVCEELEFFEIENYLLNKEINWRSN